ncbi:MAG: ABC transporter substrate-binding protein [Planctomycetota bacterium]
MVSDDHPVDQPSVPSPSTQGIRRFSQPATISIVVLGFVCLGWYLIPRGTPSASFTRVESSTVLEPAIVQHRATAPGVSATEVLIGLTGPFSGPSKDLGHQIQLGIESCFRWINDHGGISGRKLQLVYLDDGYDPEKALGNMKELHEKRQVFACLGNIGTPAAIKTIPYALEKKFLFFGGLSGAKILRKDPPDRFVFNYRPGLEGETSAAVSYLVNIRKIRPEEIAVFAQNDAFGEDGFRGVVKAMHAYGVDAKNILKVGYERNTADVKAAVQEITKRTDLRAVVMLATYKPASAFIQQVKDLNKQIVFTNVSFVGIEALGESLREAGPDYAEGIIVTEVVPPVDSSATIVLRYRETLNSYFPAEKPSFLSLEGYIAASIFAEGLKLAGENLTTDSMIESLESIDKLDLGIGSIINFSPSNHDASRKIWGSILDKSGHFHVLDLFE